MLMQVSTKADSIVKKQNYKRDAVDVNGINSFNIILILFKSILSSLWV